MSEFATDDRMDVPQGLKSVLDNSTCKLSPAGTAEAVPLGLDFSAALTLADGVIERIAREEVTTRRLRYSDGGLRVVTFLQNGVALLSLLSYIR